MIITRLEAQNFLSFDLFEVAMSPGLNVIVGPNGAGKSNVLRIATSAFTLLLAGGNGDQQQRPAFHSLAWEHLAPRIGSRSTEGSLAVHVTLDNHQLDRLALFLQAVAEVKAYEGVSRRQGATVPEDLSSLLTSCFSTQQLEPLRNGSVVVSFNRSAVPTFEVAYQFQVGPGASARPFHCVIAGQETPGAVRAGSAGGPHPPYGASGDTPIVSMDLSTSSDRSALAFESILPTGSSTEWSLHRTNVGEHPLLARCLETLRPDLLRAVHMWGLPFGAALADVIGPQLTWVEGMHQPPRFVYEPWPGYQQQPSEAWAEVPLRLYRLMLGSPSERNEFEQVKEAFKQLTGMVLALQAGEELRQGLDREHLVPVTSGGRPPTISLSWERTPGPSTGAFRCEPRVVIGDSDVRIDEAGAGAWEVLSSVTLASPHERGVALLDEPATNMFPTRQQEFLQHLRQLQSSQIVLVTHSPYLVPTATEEDLRRIVRLRGGSGSPTAASTFEAPRATATAGETSSRGSTPALSRMAARADLRAALFAKGVIAVEGECDQVLLTRILNDTRLVGAGNALDDLGVLVLDVHGDSLFGAYLDVLIGFQIPFVVFADGPALRKSSALTRDLIQRGIDVPTGRSNESFAKRRLSCESVGVFTLADSYGSTTSSPPSCAGCKKSHAQPKRGEIEWWLHRHFEAAFHAVHAGRTRSKRDKSKPALVREVLDSVDLRVDSAAVQEVVDVYKRMQLVFKDGRQATTTADA